jgi:hypothetical protein
MANETPQDRDYRTGQEQGHYGPKVDDTPNEAYSVQGVVSGQPTPETDRATAEAAVRKGVLRPSALARLEQPT